jgi:hypothetical protein
MMEATMKPRSMKSSQGWAVILAVLLAVAALGAAPSQNRELDQFFKVKTSVFNQDWSAVRSGMEAYLRDHPAGKMRDEALYWLGRGLDRLARQAKDRAEIVALKTKAAETLDRMIKEFPESLWRDDARELRLAIAGELAILGVDSERSAVEEAVRAQDKSEVELRRIALNSLVRLDAATVLPVMDEFLRTEPDPGLRKTGVSLLGRRFTRPAVGLLESVARKDASEEVRREAAYWLAKIRTRLIPLQLNYYCYEARLTEAPASGQVPEGRIASFSPPHGRPGSEGRVKAEIGRLFGGRVALSGSKATSMGAANLYEIMRTEGTTIRTSHRISGFIIGLDGGSIVKTEAGISGQVLFDGEAADFAVNDRNDALLAARRDDRLALMYLELAPKETESPEDAEAEGSSAGRESFFGSLGKLFRSRSKEPVYYTKNVLSRSGLVIWSTLQSMDSVKEGVTDYSLAKAEIPGPGGAWILTGHILRLNKEDILIGRMAKLVKPDGKVAAEGDEIRVPVKDPAAFTMPGGTAVPAPAPAPAAGVASADEAIYPVSFDLDGGGRILSPRKQFRLAELSGDAIDFGEAKAVLPGRGGNWVLTGRLVLLGTQGMITAREAVLLNAEGKVAAEGTVLIVPVKKPEAFTVAAARRK